MSPPKSSVKSDSGDSAAPRRSARHQKPSQKAVEAIGITPSDPANRRPLKRKAAEVPEASASLSADFELPENLLDASLQPWKENELEEWPSWVEVESEPVFFRRILGLLGVKNIKVDEMSELDSASFLPADVYGLIFLFQYTGDSENDERADVKEKSLWFANQTTSNACATIALLNIIMNAQSLDIGEKLKELKRQSTNLSPPSRGKLVADSTWIRVAHNMFAKRIDLLNAALALQNEVDESKKKRTKASSKVTARSKKNSHTNAEANYHFIAYVPIGNKVYELDGLESSPRYIGTIDPQEHCHWTSVPIPAMQKRMQQAEAQQLAYNLIALSETFRPPRPMTMKVPKRPESYLNEIRTRLGKNIARLDWIQTNLQGSKPSSESSPESGDSLSGQEPSEDSEPRAPEEPPKEASDESMKDASDKSSKVDSDKIMGEGPSESNKEGPGQSEKQTSEEPSVSDPDSVNFILDGGGSPASGQVIPDPSEKSTSESSEDSMKEGPEDITRATEWGKLMSYKLKSDEIAFYLAADPRVQRFKAEHQDNDGDRFARLKWKMLVEQRAIRKEYNEEQAEILMANQSSSEPPTTDSSNNGDKVESSGPVKDINDYTSAIHLWVTKLAEKGLLKDLYAKVHPKKAQSEV